MTNIEILKAARDFLVKQFGKAPIPPGGYDIQLTGLGARVTITMDAVTVQKVETLFMDRMDKFLGI